MKLVRKAFSKIEKGEEKSGKGGKIAATAIGGAVATGAATYGGLKVAQNKLGKKTKIAEEAYDKAAKATSDFAKENLEGVKNKFKNLLPGRKKEIMEQYGKLGMEQGKAMDAWLAASKKSDKINEVVRKVENPGKSVVEAVKKGVEKLGPVKDGVREGANKAATRLGGFAKSGKEAISKGAGKAVKLVRKVVKK